ncbi:MAG: DUF6268 family outer membrane beta-barrel protein [Bacteroidia bacterium]|nr:DUF6268 family outer membrane beta-barrel protein [Bacteroidia bacterium]
MTLRNCLALLLTLLAIQSIAQRYTDVIYFNQAYSPKFNKSDSANAQIFETNITLRAPLYMKDTSTILLLNISLNRTHYNFVANDQRDVFGGGYTGLILSKQWTPRLSSIQTLQVGSFSSFGDYNWSGAQYLFAGLLRYQLNPDVRLGGGIITGYRVRFFYYVPLAEIYWEINKHWDILAAAPGNFVLTYQIDSERGLGFEYEALGNVFSINRQGIDYLSESRPTFPWTYLRFGFFADRFLSQNVAIRLYGGMDVARNLLAFDQTNTRILDPVPNEYVLGNYGIKPFINFGIFYRVRNE